MAHTRAKVAIVEYGDFECPNCKQAAPAVGFLLKRFEGRVRRFAQALHDHVHAPRVRSDVATGRENGVRSTRTFFVNGQVCDVSFGVDQLERTVAKALE